MGVKPHQLAVLVEGATGTASPAVSLPRPDGVLYAPPNPDGSRKSCGNCCMWAEKDMLCMIHGSLPITFQMVCGYHVFGQPQLFSTSVIRPDGLPPELTGLEEVPGGTSCDLCRFYDSGRCRGVSDPSTNRPPAKVEALGCCARWERSEEVP